MPKWSDTKQFMKGGIKWNTPGDPGWEDWKAFRGTIFLCGHGAQEIQGSYDKAEAELDAIIVDYFESKKKQDDAYADAYKEWQKSQEQRKEEARLHKKENPKGMELRGFVKVPPGSTVSFPFRYGKKISDIKHVRKILLGTFDQEPDREFRAGAWCPNITLFKDSPDSQVPQTQDWLDSNAKFKEEEAKAGGTVKYRDLPPKLIPVMVRIRVDG